MIVSGLQAKDAISLGLGVSIVLLSLVPILRMLGVNERAVHTGVGLALVAWFVLPISNWLFGPMKMNFSIFILGGLMIVIGACWTIMYNADILLGALGATLGRVKSIAPVVRMAMAYPLRSLFRTGVTLAMFTLVVFTLVVGATTTGAFTNAFNDLNAFGGGFDVLATAAPSAPVADMSRSAKGVPGIDPSSIREVASISNLAVKARQLGPGPAPRPTSSTAPTRPSSPTPPTASPRRPRVRLGGGGVEGAPGAPGPRRRRPPRRPAQAELGVRRDVEVPAPRLLRRGQGVGAGEGERPRPADREAPRPDRDRRPRRHRAPC